MFCPKIHFTLSLNKARRVFCLSLLQCRGKTEVWPYFTRPLKQTQERQMGHFFSNLLAHKETTRMHNCTAFDNHPIVTKLE